MKKISSLLVLVLISAQSIFAQIEKMEPPFWWSGMNNSDLQVMFYGKNLAEYQVSSEGKFIIKEIIKTENPNYVFVTIDTKDLTPSEILFHFKKKTKTVFTKPYNLKKREENSANRNSYTSADVMYLIMPDRFANGNPENDSHPSLTEKGNRALPGGRHGGDIEGVRQNLDYIKDLGATAIWLTPVCEDNDKHHSYHTYGQSDVYKIDARYGTNEEYVNLSAAMKKKGLKLIKDYVTNHWGAEHWMFKDMPTYDWFHQFPGYAQSNFKMTTQFDNNASARDSKYCMDGWFVKSMPDLNQSNPLTLKYLIQNAIWWIEYADLDGFRVDTYSYNDKEGIAKWTKAITDEYPNFNIVGEVWMHDQAQISFWQKDSPIAKIKSFNSYLPSVMDFTLHDAIGTVFKEDKPSWDQGIVKVYDNFVNDFLYPNPNNLLLFTENHDTQRINNLYDIKGYKLATALIGTVRGIPQLYYGSEIGMAGNKDNGDADIRQDFPGGWKGDALNAFTNEGRTETQKAYYDFTSTLFNWRKNKNVIHSGKMTHYIPENNVYVYFRHNEKESVMVVLNNHTEKQTVDLKRFAENTKDYTKGKNIFDKKMFNLNNNLEIEGKGVLILELE